MESLLCTKLNWCLHFHFQQFNKAFILKKEKRKGKGKGDRKQFTNPAQEQELVRVPFRIGRCLSALEENTCLNAWPLKYLFIFSRERQNKFQFHTHHFFIDLPKRENDDKPKNYFGCQIIDQKFWNLKNSLLVTRTYNS